MERESLVFSSAVELLQFFRDRQISPVELVDLFLDRIRNLNPKLNAYLTVTGEEAKEAAQKAEAIMQKEKELPPLFGIPISIKDLTFTRGIRTTGGSLAYANFIPNEDAVAVERLLKAGAIIMGKTNTPEFGLAATTENNLGEDCCNPWNTNLVAGGSSGGAAVSVAAGMTSIATGSDGGGSIRIPSSMCGVYGFKPTIGLVPSVVGFGGMPLFGTIGPITHTVADAALMLNVIAGPDPRDATCLRSQPPDFVKAVESRKKPDHFKIAWSPDLGYAAVDPEVLSVTKAMAFSFESFGCNVEEASPIVSDARESIWKPIALADEYAAHAHIFENKSHLLVSYVKADLEYGKRVSGAEYSKALQNLWYFRRQMEFFFDKYDLLLTPTLAVPAFPRHQRPKGINVTEVNPRLFYPDEIDGKKVPSRYGFYPFTYPFNITGQPAATVPCGLSKDGLPIGLQIVGRYGEDITVLKASAAFEKAHPWRHRRPPVS